MEKTVGVALDPWKVPVFKSHLDAAGYTYTEHPSPSLGIVMFQVKTQDIAKLQTVLTAANTECKN